jgi:hypothetical protein
MFSLTTIAIIVILHMLHILHILHVLHILVDRLEDDPRMRTSDIAQSRQCTVGESAYDTGSRKVIVSAFM